MKSACDPAEKRPDTFRHSSVTVLKTYNPRRASSCRRSAATGSGIVLAAGDASFSACEARGSDDPCIVRHRLDSPAGRIERRLQMRAEPVWKQGATVLERRLRHGLQQVTTPAGINTALDSRTAARRHARFARSLGVAAAARGRAVRPVYDRAKRGGGGAPQPLSGFRSSPTPSRRPEGSH